MPSDLLPCCGALLALGLLGILNPGAADADPQPPGADLADPALLAAPPAGAPGFPGRGAGLDALPGFQSPPPGYGEVPFWWWTGDPLDRDRLLWQLNELQRQGVRGMQVNYCHEDSPGWPTYAAEPEVFSEPWWDTWTWFAGECRKRGMGVGISGYTLDWPGHDNLFGRLIYSDPDLWGTPLQVARREVVEAGARLHLDLPAQSVVLRAYRTDTGSPQLGGVDLMPAVRDQTLDWSPAEGRWEVWAFTAPPQPRTLNPLHPQSGQRVIERFLQPFQDKAPGQTSAGLNYFFQDELNFGVGGWLWGDDVATEFGRRKGYSLAEVLPALFTDCGPLTPKVRLDFMDVQVGLAEERYFAPIFRWHWSRGMIYGCDPGSRGGNPAEFGDYFRAIRWYSAPGHDTPGGNADLIKGKVSSSIAHLYQRPRVWLEGYHSLGWGATPERLMQATCENYVYGCTLLNLHGLYYTTHGSFWEWAPPCYHFRMPYWAHMPAFLKYFERLSYLLSQGVHRCDVAIVYPVAPFDAGMGGQEATNTAFAAGRALAEAGIDFDFVDHESLARAQVRDGRLEVSGESYRVLVLPAMRAARWSTLTQARALQQSGGTVIALGALPEASDRAGREDPELNALVAETFGTPEPRRSAAGGLGMAVTSPAEPQVRHYDGGFAGRWVWSSERTPEVFFKAVWPGEPATVRVRFLCDNAGALYVNGQRLCQGADYSQGWMGEVTLKGGDVITADAHDDDNGDHSAGLFLALVRDGRTVLSAQDLRYTLARPDDWRTSRDLTGLAVPDPANVHELHRGAGAGGGSLITSVLDLLPRDVRATPAVKSLHRRVGDRDIYMVMGAARGSECTFAARGRAELWDPWTGEARPLHVVAEAPEGTRVRMPLEAYQAQVIVFSPEPAGPTVSATDLEGVAEVQVEGEEVSVSGFATSGGARTATVQLPGRSVVVTAEAPEPPEPLALEGPWEFELQPTLDNRWGDFRLPVTESVLGAEARTFRYAQEEGTATGWETPGFDDSQWQRVTCGFGPKFWKLGPLSEQECTPELEARLAALDHVDPGQPVPVDGRQVAWTPYAFSWRWGVEGDPGHQGYHGLKENVTDEFLCLGRPTGGLNETLYVPEEAGTRYYLWTSVTPGDATVARLDTGGLLPAAVYSDGAPLPDPRAELPLGAGTHTLLLRYDNAGRGHLVLERAGATLSEPRTPLAMQWYDRPGVLPFDPRPEDARPAGWYRFTAPPGLRGMTLAVRGTVQVWVEGQAQTVEPIEGLRGRARQYRVSLPQPVTGRAQVALRVQQERGYYGGEALPEPVLLDCGPGQMEAGDWSRGSALECYSGGAWYRRTVMLEPERTRGRVLLHLGDVAATAEVHVNGRRAGVLVAPPWSVDLTPFVKPGENRLEILVYNTLANHYQTIPTNYRGSPRSGLLGPVRIETRSPVRLTR